jgi:hypothetical protein
MAAGVLPFGVTEGMTEHVIVAGAPPQFKVTGWLKPPLGVTNTV